MNLNVFRIVLAIVLLVCLLDMPYGYYQFVRFVSTGSFLFLAFHTNKCGESGKTVLFVALALLFQPFFKIALGRELWNVVDVIVGVWLLFEVLSEKRKT